MIYNRSALAPSVFELPRGVPVLVVAAALVLASFGGALLLAIGAIQGRASRLDISLVFVVGVGSCIGLFLI